MSRKDLINSDQTVFVDQAPLWQKTTKNKLDLKNNLQKNRHLRPFYYLLAFLLVIFILFIILLMTRKSAEINQIIDPASESVEETSDPLEKRVETLQAELEMADPTRQSLPFPNIDLELSFD